MKYLLLLNVWHGFLHTLIDKTDMWINKTAASGAVLKRQFVSFTLQIGTLYFQKELDGNVFVVL